MESLLRESMDGAQILRGEELAPSGVAAAARPPTIAVLGLAGAEHERLLHAFDQSRFQVTDDQARLSDADAVIVCVPVPVDARHAGLGALREACEAVCRHARRGQTIVLTSTIYVGATQDLLVQPLAEAGFEVGRDICVAFSPERLDAADASHPHQMAPRLLGASDQLCTGKVRALLDPIASSIHVVSSPEAAEMATLYANVFRAVNVSLADELAEAAETLGLSAAEVTEALATQAPSPVGAGYPSSH